MRRNKAALKITARHPIFHYSIKKMGLTKTPGAAFTKLHFIINLQMGLIS
jgi:hypothetical protein